MRQGYCSVHSVPHLLDVIFGILYTITGAQFDIGDYSQLDMIFVIGIQTWRNSIGDIAAPVYPRWDEMSQSTKAGKQFLGKMMIMIIWFIWIFHQFVILIILLNFLIAIISQSYEDVMSKSEQMKYKTRVDLNLECLQTYNFFGKLPSFNILLIASQNEEDGQSDQQWQGIVNTMKSFTRQSFKLQKETVEKMFDIKIEVVRQET